MKSDDILALDDDHDVEEDEDWKASAAYKRYSKICRTDIDAMHNYVS